MSDYKRWTDKNWKQFDCSEMYKAFAELEDKIENDTLVELPCKAGYTLYYLGKTTKWENDKLQSDYFITSCYVAQITITFADTKPVFRIDLMTDKLGSMIWNGETGKTHFFKTKAEAEAKLEELKRGQK